MLNLMLRFDILSFMILNCLVSISNSAFIFETKRDLFVVNDETLQLSHVTWVQSASICFNKCSDKISDISKMVSEFSEDSQKCSCFICSRGKLRDFSDPEESKGKSRTYSSEYELIVNTWILFRFL